MAKINRQRDVYHTPHRTCPGRGAEIEPLLACSVERVGKERDLPTKLLDVARQAGVSLTTASFALRGSRRVSDATTRRVLKIAAELNYSPDPAARNLASTARKEGAYHGTLGLLMPQNLLKMGVQHLQRPHEKNFFDEIPDTAAALGHSLDLFEIPSTPKAARGLQRILETRGIKGLIVDTGNMPIPDFGFPWENFATVFMGTLDAQRGFHNLSCHSFKDTYTGVTRCFDRGYRRFGLVIDRSGFPDWQGGFEAAVNLHQVRRESHSLDLPVWDAARFLTWFRKYQPEVVLANHGAKPLNALREIGLEAPRDYGLFALDLHGISDPLSGYDQMRTRCNQLAVEIIHGCLRRGEIGVPTVATTLQVNSHWVEGTTLRSG